MNELPRQAIRRVMHCDLDCFYAAVEELDDPSITGKPVIVGGDPERRGVVSTANYVARRYGVHSAMSAALARRLCPTAVFLRPRFERYRELSSQTMRILDDYFVVREQVSVDEAYGELPPAWPGCRPAELLAREIKARVRTEVGLVISIGVGRTKSIAKLACDYAKPDGCLVVKPDAEHTFLRPLPVGKLSGVGPHTYARLERLGLRTVGDIADADPAELERHLGKHGHWLWQLATGHDDRPVVNDHGPPKSVSRETTFECDLASLERAEVRLRELAESVASRAERERLKGRTVHLKARWADFRRMTRQCPLDMPTADAEIITRRALEMFASEVAPAVRDGHALRLLGVGLSGFAGEGSRAAAFGFLQPPLFPAELAS